METFRRLFPNLAHCEAHELAVLPGAVLLLMYAVGTMLADYVFHP